MDLILSSAALRNLLSPDSPSSAPITLLDVREPEEYAECRIEGCVLIPMGELLARAPRELKTDADIVVYCAHGIRSLQAALALRQLGFGKVRSLQGGLAAWFEESNPNR